MDFFKIFSNKQTSKDMAKERLKLILIHDRSDFSQDFLEDIKEALLKVISNYAEIDKEGLNVKLAKTDECDGCKPALIASIPIKKMKNRY
ncbi:cell division topological specificity factor MinE [Haloimpatiens lingqiaonensis]|uniref:cell division topological specificity factor MinE n=1 Tax=Haloimpatiens lingqiaonensis TaxID=1380675 RepID=UPI0010FDBB1F|nr:cell division topological specificity factor MinE [Haloimpatiens lingqiaonensis]